MSVRQGTAHISDSYCVPQVRALVDSLGKEVGDASPSIAVQMGGLGAVPTAGDEFAVRPWVSPTSSTVVAVLAQPWSVSGAYHSPSCALAHIPIRAMSKSRCCGSRTDAHMHAYTVRLVEGACIAN